jgi:hypothetical protein
MQDYVPTIIACGGSLGEAVDYILASKLLRRLRNRHGNTSQDLGNLYTRITESWPQVDGVTEPVRTLEIIRDETRKVESA